MSPRCPTQKHGKRTTVATTSMGLRDLRGILGHLPQARAGKGKSTSAFEVRSLSRSLGSRRDTDEAGRETEGRRQRRRGGWTRPMSRRPMSQPFLTNYQASLSLVHESSPTNPNNSSTVWPSRAGPAASAAEEVLFAIFMKKGLEKPTAWQGRRLGPLGRPRDMGGTRQEPRPRSRAKRRRWKNMCEA